MLVTPSLLEIVYNICFSFHPDKDFELVLLLAAFYIIWIGCFWLLPLYLLWNQKPAKALSLAWGIGLICIWPTSALLRWFPVGDYVHLAADYPKYEAAIMASPNTRLSFDWGGWGFSFTVNGTRTLYYDPTDKLLQENTLRDIIIRKKSRYVRNKQEFFSAWLVTKPLYNHFYVVEEWHR